MRAAETRMGEAGSDMRRFRWPIIVLVAVWPFLYYYRCIVPGHSSSLAVGNDFSVLYYNYKVYLLDLLASGRIPLWSPSEAAGFPFYSSPFAQAFYPLNVLLVVYYRITGGYSVFDGQAFTVLAMAIYAVGLFLWLSLLLKNVRALLFATLVISVSFKLGDIMRFPNALHAAAWMPWILYGFTLAGLQGRHMRGALVVFGSCLMLLSAGYPYYVYYCLFLVPPYVLILLLPSFRAALSPHEDAGALSYGRFLAATGCACIAALLICAPYLAKMAQLLDQTVDRGSASYVYATLHEFFWKDTLGSLIFPPAAQTEGWYYFGILGVLLLVLWISAAVQARREQPREALLVATAGAWFWLITFVTYGEHSYLFEVLWHHLPGFARLRAWGRLNIVMLPVLALCLARAYQFLEGVLVEADDCKRRKVLGLLLGTLIVAAVVVVGTQVALIRYKVYDFYWIYHFKHAHGCEWLFPVAAVGAFVVLLAALAAAWRAHYARGSALALLLVACIVLTVVDLRPVGAHQWLVPAKPETWVRQPLHMDKAISRSLLVNRVYEEDTTVALNSRFNVGFLQNWYFERYVGFTRLVFSGNRFGQATNRDELPWFRRLMGLDDGQRFFFSRDITHRSLRGFFQDADETRRQYNPELQVIEYNGDRLVVQVQTAEPVFFSFIDNWDPDWTAEINGEPVEILRLFGTFKSVELPAGTSRVVMAYLPFGR